MITNQLVDRAMQRAQGAQALVAQTETTEIFFENDVLKSAETSQSTEISVRLVLDGKVGTSRGTDIDDPNGIVARAMEVAEFGQACHYGFPGYRPGRDVKVYDEAVVALTKAEMIRTGREMQAVIKAYNPSLAFRGGIRKSVENKAFANSSGASFTAQSTSFLQWGLGLRMRNHQMFEAWYGQSSRRRAMDHIAIANRTVEMLHNAENDATIRSGPMPVIFAPIAMDVVLLPLRLGLDGKHVLTEYSSLGSKIGRQITDARFSLTDDPFIDYASRSSTYDDEGVPRQVLPLIENGVVRNFLYDLDAAGRAGAQSTGHGEGRDTTNLTIRPGATPYADIVKNTPEGLLVCYVMGLGQGNPVSGDFSIGVRVGYKIENGEIVGLVRDIMVTGNVFDALNRIIAISSEAEAVSGVLCHDGVYPYIQVDSLNVVTG
ncbi:MAG: TldD/PmbA family protein [Anaerolineae bacterium]|nr:TldD/PmbA family protein [Anaerolineae bacterium]